ncbi:MAG: hypothetical protein AB8B80_15745 [Marinicellaceae bacterium]
MSFIFILALIIIGAVAASGFVEKKLPQVKSVMEFIKPHSQWVGLVSLVLGIFWLFRILFYLGTMLKYFFVLTLIQIASNLLLIILGFLLAQPLIMQLVGKNKNVSEAADKMRDKFAPLKEKLGLAAIAFGLVNLLLLITR